MPFKCHRHPPIWPTKRIPDKNTKGQAEAKPIIPNNFSIIQKIIAAQQTIPFTFQILGTVSQCSCIYSECWFRIYFPNSLKTLVSFSEGPPPSFRNLQWIYIQITVSCRNPVTGFTTHSSNNHDSLQWYLLHLYILHVIITSYCCSEHFSLVLFSFRLKQWERLSSPF